MDRKNNVSAHNESADTQISNSTLEDPKPTKGLSGMLFLLIILLVLLGIVLTVKPIRQKILGRRNVPTTVQPTFSPLAKPTGSAQTPAPSIPSQNGSTTTTKSDTYGVNTGILVTEEPYFNSALDYASSLGVGWIRLGNDWFDLEPTDNKWNFSVADTYIDAAFALGLHIVYLFDPDLNGKFCTMSPAEASLGKKAKCSDEQFKDYIGQIVSRYKGKVQYYELGNEPDLRRTWNKDAIEYARALALAYSTLKAADPNAKLLLGGLAFGGGQNADLAYLDKLIAQGALNNFDIMNYHTYDKKEGVSSQYNNAKSKVGGKPIWITEVGFPSDSAEQQKSRSNYPYSGGEEGQAGYMKDILPHILSLGVEKVFWYNLADVPRDSSSFCTYGLVYISGKQCLGNSAGRTTGGTLQTKKAYSAYQALISK